VPSKPFTCQSIGARHPEKKAELGTVEAGKIANPVIVDGNPDADTTELRRIMMVFKDGVGFDSPKLFSSGKGTIGIR
jgi:imidazolonepropionase-like amidohydrolase